MAAMALKIECIGKRTVQISAPNMAASKMAASLAYAEGKIERRRTNCSKNDVQGV